MRAMRFRDRKDAGRRLGERLKALRIDGLQPAPDILVVLGLPRGGVPVAAEVATALGAPLDVILVRKLGVPFQPELAMGAVGEGGVRLLNRRVLAEVGVSEAAIQAVETHERAELERRARLYRGDGTPVDLAGRIAVIVDDGIATGSTARAACQVARALGADRVVLAVPVAPPGWTERLADVADELVCLSTPASFFAIGEFYDDFSQMSDEEVLDCLARAAPSEAEGSPPRAGSGQLDAEIAVPIDGLALPGQLTVPSGAVGVVVFAHGSGSSRHSPRNRYVAGTLNARGIGTLLIDLLTAREEKDRGHVFDIPLLADRLHASALWVRSSPPPAGELPIAFFGASTGAAAALVAAARAAGASGTAEPVAVVSRGGRPDLAGDSLAAVRAPTLLIVGSLDTAVLELNEEARSRMHCATRLEVVPGASHLFEEPGTLEQVAELAGDWFEQHFGVQATRDGARRDRG